MLQPSHIFLLKIAHTLAKNAELLSVIMLEPDVKIFLQAQQFSHLFCFQAIVLSINISLFHCSSEVAACLTCSLNELHFRHCSVSDKKYLRTALLEV